MSAIREKSIAVLPFENLAAIRITPILLRGSRRMLTRLAKIADLKVFPHFDAALSEQTWQSLRDRQAAWRRSHPGRKRAKERRGCARERPAD